MVEARTHFSIGDFGDKRLNKVGSKLFQSVLASGSLIIKSIAKRRSEEVRFGRFLGNSRVKVATMLKSAQENIRQILRTSKAKHVLLIQDSSEFKFPRRKDEIRGLGVVKNTKTIGAFVHATIAVDAADTFIMGLADSYFWWWPKDKTTKERREIRKTKPPESMRWIDAIVNAKKCLTQAKMVTSISDRESDMFSLYTAAKKNDVHFIVRTKGVRQIEVDKTAVSLRTQIPSWEAVDEKVIEVAARPSKKNSKKAEDKIRGNKERIPARQANLSLKFKEIEILRPKTLDPKAYEESFKAYCVHVEETNPPSEEEKISWTLITSHEITNAKEAWDIVNFYRIRWRIETLFRTCKKGGYNAEGIDAVKEETIVNLCFLALLATIRTMQLTSGRDGLIDRPADAVLDKDEIEVLKDINPGLEGNTEAQKNPFRPSTLAWAYWVIGRLGGWKGYSSTGPAGASVIKRGLDKLEKYLEVKNIMRCVHQ